MEIERKFTIKELPANLENQTCLIIEQAYLNTDPVIRIRRQNDEYYLTYKGKGLLAREEYNLPLNKEAYEHLKEKVDGRLICKKRYMIPLKSPINPELMIELDVFEEELAPLVLAEVEFQDEETANTFIAPEWFGEDVTFCGKYHNSYLSKL